MGRLLISALRAACRSLQTHRERVPAWHRALLFVVGVHLYALAAPLLWLLHRTVGLPRVEVEAISGARFSCRVHDIIDGYIAFFGVWEPATSAWLQRTLRPGDVFIDVGANVGHHSLLAWRRVGDRGRVVAIEPSPAIVTDLERNLSLNGSPTTIEVCRAAATGGEREVRLFRGGSWNRGRTSTVRDLGHGVETTVGGSRLRDLVGEDLFARARVLKIDVEGAEAAILADLAGDLDALQPEVALLVEVTPAAWSADLDPGQVLRPYLDAGFTVQRIDNPYGFWHALWPHAPPGPRPVHDPRRLSGAQHDLLLTRGRETR